VVGTLHHFVHTLKKVARFPSKDRLTVLHDLKRRVQKRHGKDCVNRFVEVVSKGESDGASSSSSVNND